LDGVIDRLGPVRNDWQYAAPTAATGGQSHLRKLQSTGGTGVPPV
jgi:hypothetical protein